MTRSHRLPQPLVTVTMRTAIVASQNKKQKPSKTRSMPEGDKPGIARSPSSRAHFCRMPRPGGPKCNLASSASAVVVKRLFSQSVKANNGKGARAKGSSQRQRFSHSAEQPVAAQAKSSVSRLSRAAPKAAPPRQGRCSFQAPAVANIKVVARRSAVPRLRVIQ